MKAFKIVPSIAEYADFRTLAKELNLGERDLILTNEYIYNPTIAALNLGCHTCFQEKYGAGEPTDVMYEMIEVVNAILPEDRPRYLMGVGTPINILEGIARGVDMFDCVMPTRNGRNGQIFTSEGTINIRNKKWEDDFSPIDPEGTAFVDHVYTKAYLHHLTICQEMLGAQIASLHNIAFYLRLVTEARRHIGAGDFTPWKEQMVAKLGRRL